MENIREVIVANLLRLRRKNQMTQQELAKRINYSDKAVSRWENGEVLPDVETLSKIAEVYGVTLPYLLETHEESTETAAPKDPSIVAKAIIAAISVCVIWAIVVVVYVYIRIFLHTSYWQAFVWAVPASTVVAQVFNTKWLRIPLLSPIAVSLTIWTTLAAIYCSCIRYNIWLIFLIGIPFQAIVCLLFLLKREKEKTIQ